VTLQTLRQELEYPADRLEIVVVDNASTDGTAEMVARDFPSVRLVRNSVNVGAPAFNQAYGDGKGDWFLVLDDDCYLSGGDLKLALDRASDEDADLVSFFVLSASGESETSFTRWSTTGLLSFWGCSWLISRRAVERLGGYDPYFFMWGNEVELTMRLLDAGFKHLYLPEIKSVHMKMPSGWTFTGHRRNLRHWAYTATKLLRARDAVPSIANLLLRVLLESGQRPQILKLLPEVLGGARDGLRNRSPVKESVSHLYRLHFMEFVSPLRWVRGPATRWRQRGAPGGADKDLQDRRDRFFAERREVYPVGSGALRL